MVIYKEAGVELIQARGSEGRFQLAGVNVRLGVFNDADVWYIGVHQSAGGLVARLSLEDAKSLKEAKDMLKYGFFLQLDDQTQPIVDAAVTRGLLAVPSLATSQN